MICKKCGCRVNDAATFCDKCGAPMAEFGEKEGKVSKKPMSKKGWAIITAFILCALILFYGANKVGCANRAVKAVRMEYDVVSSVKEVYVNHVRFGLENVYVVFANGNDYVCHVWSGNNIDIITRYNYPYGTGTEKIELYEGTAETIREDGISIPRVLLRA